MHAYGTGHAEAQGRKSSPMLANASALYRGVKIPKSGKEGFGVKKLPFPNAPEKGALSRKIPIFCVEPCREMGIFRLKSPFSGALGNGSFSTPKPSFLILGILTPVQGRRVRNPMLKEEASVSGLRRMSQHVSCGMSGQI